MHVGEQIELTSIDGKELEAFVESLNSQLKEQIKNE